MGGGRRAGEGRTEGGGRVYRLLVGEGVRDGEGLDDRVDVPLVVLRVLLDDVADPLRQLVLELDVARDQVREQLLDEDLDVRLVDERVDELEGTLADRRVGVLQAVDDRVAVALHRLRVGGDDLVQRVQRDVPDVVVAVDQEAAEDVDREDAEAALAAAP